ncbi:MAG: AAA family ATPase [bacterium]|nr:AAA family ATPase [bacterium]
MREVIIIAGANGSGKTTFAKYYSEKYPFDFINADEIAKEISPDNLEHAKVEAGKRFFRTVDLLIKSGKSFLIESTLSGKYMTRLIPRLKSNGYSVKIIYIFLESPVVCIERIKERVLKGGHFVPTDDVIRRFTRSKRNFWNLYKQMSDEWIVIYNSEEKFLEVAIGTKEDYIINSEELLKKFLEEDIDES